MRLQDAQTVVTSLIERLSPACEQIAVAGSVRRRKEEVKDIEIVCLPHYEADAQGGLFAGVALGVPDEPAERYAFQLWDTLSRLCAEKLLAFDRATPRNGAKYKRFVVTMPRPQLPALHIPLDLFIAQPENYGNTLAIRTGDAEFSKALVTLRRMGGLMPSYLRQKDGYLWHDDQMIPCRTEQEFFAALGVQWIEPQFRNKAMAVKLAREIVKA